MNSLGNWAKPIFALNHFRIDENAFQPDGDGVYVETHRDLAVSKMDRV